MRFVVSQLPCIGGFTSLFRISAPAFDGFGGGSNKGFRIVFKWLGVPVVGSPGSRFRIEKLRNLREIIACCAFRSPVVGIGRGAGLVKCVPKCPVRFWMPVSIALAFDGIALIFGDRPDFEGRPDFRWERSAVRVPSTRVSSRCLLFRRVPMFRRVPLGRVGRGSLLSLPGTGSV